MLLLCLLTGYKLVYAQRHVEFQQTFAPSQSWTHPSETISRQSICLNGKWQFAPADLPAGFKEGIDPAPELPVFNKTGLEKTPIRIPSPWNVNNFADKNGLGGDFVTFPSYPKHWESIKMGWLYRKFKIPANWKGKVIKLHFEAVAGNAQILINGENVGHHFDIFLPFDLDITKYVHFGAENELCVGVRKASLFDHRGEHGRRSYQAGSFWGQHIAGIWQDVELTATSPTYIDNVYVEPLVDADKLVAEVRLRNESDRPARMQLGGNAYAWHNLAGKDILSAPVPAGELDKTPALRLETQLVTIPAKGELTVTLTAKVNQRLKQWSPEAPNLYGLVIKAGDADVKYTRFGWRQTRIQGKDFLLNGKPIILKGDSWHFMGIPQMTRRYAWAWFTALKAANLNAVRLHAEPYPSFYLDMADEMGIMVLDESAMWASDGGPKLDDPAYWKDSEQHMAGLVKRDRNHPSVFGWSISNEIMPVVRGVMHNPPGMREQLVNHYRIWADTCRKLDPSRPWISADGEDDGDGLLPVYIVHYGGFQSMDRGLKSTKPWGVGEAGNAYYGTPEQVAGTNGNRAYESFRGRMEGVAVSSYQSLMAQRERKATYRSVFNLAWYGLQPLTLGMKDTSLAPRPDDGIYFTKFREGEEGVQPERLGPYTTTFNPGYDPALPLYKTWPLFEAIRDASANEPGPSKWAKVTAPAASRHTELPAVRRSFRIIGGTDSRLEEDLKTLGLVTTAQQDQEPEILLIDGTHPPSKNATPLIAGVINRGGKVVVWGADATALVQLNKLLPAPLSLTNRAASSLIIKRQHPALKGLSLAGLYFSEQSPAEVITSGLAGPLVAQSDTLLEDCNTDWLKWNKQPEYAKTAMVLRSERERKPSGVVMISKKSGKGEWLITTFPAGSRLLKVQLAVRKMLTNLGLPLNADNAAAAVLNKGKIVHVLAAGPAATATFGETLAKTAGDLNKMAAIKNGSQLDGKEWQSRYSESGVFTLADGTKTAGQDQVTYISCWIASPRSLEDLLLEPNLPTVNLEIQTDGAAQAWLNGAPVLQNVRDAGQPQPKTISSPLKLRQGWNYLLIRLVRTQDSWHVAGQLLSTQPEFIDQLNSSIEKP